MTAFVTLSLDPFSNVVASEGIRLFLIRIVVMLVIRINVSFPSGSGETPSLPEHYKVGDLKLLAQRSLGKGFLGGGNVLTNPMEFLQAAGIQEGDCLTAVVQQPKMTATEQAFVVWCCGGNKVVSWGASDSGGDCSTVQDQLTNVKQIQAAHRAFAWGNRRKSGDCSRVQDQLKNVQQNQQILAVELFIFMEKRVCVCTVWIDVKLRLIILYYIILYLWQGITGVPGGSVINEDTPPGPVKTYLRDCGGAPGRI